MKISDDRGKISDLAGKRDISEISNSTGRYFFPWAARSGSGEVEVGVEGAWLRGRRSSARDAEGGDAGDPVRCLL
jgi:hypothetical protein